MRKTVNLLALAVAGVGLCYSTANAQFNWEEIGPNNQGNHVRAIAVDNSGTVWAGSVGGGLWKSTDRGSSWLQASGLSENLAVSSIAIEGNKIFVGTGENLFYKPSASFITTWSADSVTTFRSGFYGYSGAPGQGVFVSTDGGNTFTHNNGTWGPSSTPYSGPFKSIQKIATNGNRTFVAALDGLYYSDDNLATVTKCAGSAAFMSRPIMDVEVAAGNVVIAVTKDSVFRSTNNGSNFGTRINDAIFSGGTTPNNRVGGHRIAIEVAPSNKSIVYITGASDINGNCTGVWKSTDAGATWARVAPYESSVFLPFGGQGEYSMVMAVHPTDPDAIVLGGKRMYKFTPATGWITSGSSLFFPGFTTNFVPSPQLVIAVDPSSDSTYYVGTDAEIVRTDNFGVSFTNKTKGLNTSHLYGIDGSVKFEILASDRYKGILYKDNANSNVAQLQFTDINPRSEGGIARWSPNMLKHIISQGPDGGLERSFDNGLAYEPFYGVPLEPFHPSIASQDSLYIDRADTSSSGGALYDVGITPVTPWCYDAYIPAATLLSDSLLPLNPAYLYMCSKSFVWVCTNPYGSIDSIPRWNRITNDLTRSSFSGGKREHFTALACANDLTHNVWVGTNDGRLYRIFHANLPSTVDVNLDVVRVDDANMPHRWITDIAIDPNNSNIVVVTYGSYAAGDARVWITNNGNDTIPTWRSAQGNLPAELPVYSAAFSNIASDKTLLLGTEEGLYASTIDYTNTGTSFSWSNESGPIGNAMVTDIVFRRHNINYTTGNHYKFDPDNTILVATHGRGAFKSRALVSTPDKEIAGTGISMTASPNPSSSHVVIQIDLPLATDVTLEAYDLQGHQVAALSSRTYGVGQNQIGFETASLPAGVYLIKGLFTNSKGTYQHTLRQVVVK